MPISIKVDNIRNGTKANNCHGQLRQAQSEVNARVNKSNQGFRQTVLHWFQDGSSKYLESWIGILDLNCYPHCFQVLTLQQTGVLRDFPINKVQSTLNKTH